jgi:glycerophosphoryl diester phosphodiesterase
MRISGLQAAMPALIVLMSSTAFANPVTLNGMAPIVINHRGASGYLPEESVQAYQLSMAMHTNFLEGDVYLTKDKVAVMLHDGTLNATTNVVSYATTHPDILALKSADGSYDVTKFTYAQVTELTAGFRNANGYGTLRAGYYDPTVHYEISSLSGMLDLAYNNFLATGEKIGVYPEAKQSGLDVADAILAALSDSKYNGYFTGGEAYLQSFDPAQVAYMNGLTDMPVTQLGVCPATVAQATQIASYSDGVGPSTGQTNAACVQIAHDAGLYVHPYTFLYTPSQYVTYYNMGVDGVFTNFAPIAEEVRAEIFAPEPASLAMFGFGLATLGLIRRRGARL